MSSNPKKQQELFGAGGSGNRPRLTLFGSHSPEPERENVFIKWWRFRQLFITYFDGMNRRAQETFIVRCCQFIVLLVAVGVVAFFYLYLSDFLRITVLPFFLALSWCAATDVLAPVVIEQLRSKLCDYDY